MGAVADGALAAGGEVIGVIPQELVDRELAHGGLTELHVVGSLHERKALMAELADAFVALPGGFGTLDELMEQLTWSQLGLHAKPVGLLDVEGYWRPLIALARHATDEGFVREADLGGDRGRRASRSALLDRLERLTREARPRPKWSTPAGALERQTRPQTTLDGERRADRRRRDARPPRRAAAVLHPSRDASSPRQDRELGSGARRASRRRTQRRPAAASNVEAEDVGERLRGGRAHVVDRRAAGRARAPST